MRSRGFLGRQSLSVLLSSVALLLTGYLPPLPVYAGPNAGGTLILHSQRLFDCSSQFWEDPCGCDNLPVDCAGANSSVVTDDVYFAHLFAAFPSGSSPQLAGLTFGLESSGGLAVAYPLNCAEFELPTADWPASGSGNALVFDPPRTGLLIHAMVIGVYAYASYGAGTVDLTPHPVQGGSFADGSTPAVVDPIAAYGSMGFLVDGSVPCPDDLGACCLDGAGTCVYVTSDECASLGGTFYAGVACEPNPCEITPVIETTWGRIKVSSGQ